MEGVVRDIERGVYMLLNPWRRSKLLQERLTSAEASVKRYYQINIVLNSMNLTQARELSYLNAALRRKNSQLKWLRLGKLDPPQA